jgi:ABC-type dipeptide/oligopeptide/nickel transport system ATPase component
MLPTMSRFGSILKPVRVIALVGESGTGKSFRAKLVARKYGVDLIIDDGLLIRGDTILAGKSAKKEPVFMKAVRTALFDDKPHRDEVAKALSTLKYHKILILGTSDKMVNKIADRLQIPQPEKIVRIEEIATQADIEKAQFARKVEGKHVIPVPAIEIRRSYPRIFYDSVRVFLKRSLGLPPGRSDIYEKAVVRPEYSKRGRVSISEDALAEMVIQCVAEWKSTIKVLRVSIRSDSQGYVLTLEISLPLGTQISGNIHQLQEYIVDNIERFTGILIEEVNIIIDRLTPSKGES